MHYELWAFRIKILVPPESVVTSIHQCEAVFLVYALLCFPVVGNLMGKCNHSRKNSKWLQA